MTRVLALLLTPLWRILAQTRGTSALNGSTAECQKTVQGDLMCVGTQERQDRDAEKPQTLRLQVGPEAELPNRHNYLTPRLPCTKLLQLCS